MREAEVLVHDTPEALATAVAARFVARLVELQREGTEPSVVLTGGSIAAAIHAAVVASPDRAQVDWTRVDFWFGDERFVPRDDPDRNIGQARRAMLDHLPVDPRRVHPMAPSDGAFGDDVDAAAAAYAEQLGDTAFDVLMLGIGPDGHCASLFPGRPEVQDQRPAVAVRDSPKPPPTRISLTLEPLSRASEVWWVASGEGKAAAVRDAVQGADPADVPAAGPHGRDRTLWFLDRDAASAL